MENNESTVPVLYDRLGKEMAPSQKNMGVGGGGTNFFSNFSGTGSSLTTREIEQRPYQFNAWVYVCCYTILKNVSRLPVVLFHENDPTELIRDHEVLNVIRRPNPLMTKRTMVEAILLALFLPSRLANNLRATKGGQSFILPIGGDIGVQSEIDNVDLSRGMIPDVLLPYTDQFIEPYIVKGNNGLAVPMGWKFEIPGSPQTRKIFLNNEIIRVANFNPYNWLEGLPEMHPASIAMAQDVKSDIFNSNLFENDAIPAGILKTEANISPKQKKQELDHWNQTMGGPGNARRTAILNKGLEYQNIGMTQADMQYDNLKDYLQEQISAVWSLNKIAFGKYEDVNFATIREGRKMLWQDTYLPAAQLIEEAFNVQWIQYIEKGLRMRFDTSAIEYLRPDYTFRAKNAGVLVEKCYFSPALAAKKVEIPLSEKDIKENPWLLENPALLKAQSKGSSDKSPEETAALRTTKLIENKLQKEAEEEDPELKEQVRVDYWNKHVTKVLNPGEKDLIKIMRKFFERERNAMQDKVDTWVAGQKTLIGKLFGFKAINVKPEEFLLNINDETKKLVKVYKPVVKEQMERTEDQLEDELGELIEFNVTDDMVEEFLKKRLLDLKGINITTMDSANDKINEAIDDAVSNNLTPAQAAKKIKAAISEVGEVRKNQSKMIARTEIGIITSTTRFAAFKKEGIEFHEWVSSRDGKVRETHKPGTGDDGTVRKVGNIFPVTELMFPLDPNGKVGEIINCRCVAVAADGPET